MGNDDISFVPPYSNRGVQNTGEGALKSSVDWFSCTLLEELDWLVISDLIDVNSERFKPMKNGQKGYKSGVFFNGIRILYDGAEGMGIHLDMSGEGCRTFESFSSLEWAELFQILLTDYSMKFNVTRIDLAVDDFEGYFRVPTLIKYLKRGHVTSRFKNARRINSIIIKTGEEIGHTVYFGSSQSDVQVRFYEKNVEQEMKGNEIPEGVEIWNRTEIQARNERARAFVYLIAHETMPLGKIITGTLKNYIQFRRELKDDQNKSRWPLARFWIRFLGDCEKIQLTKLPVQKSIEKKFKWVDHSVKKTLAMLAVAFKNDASEMINDLISEGYSDLKDEDYMLIQRFADKDINYHEFIESIKKDSNSSGRN